MDTSAHASLFKALVIFFLRLLPKHHRKYFYRKYSNNIHISSLSSSSSTNSCKFQRLPSLLQRWSSRSSAEQQTITADGNSTVQHQQHDNYNLFAGADQTLVIFNVEEALLKSTSLFPYFMLVAFEAGSPIRALLLLLIYPLISFLGRDMKTEIMIFISFFGIRADKFHVVSRGVLPKFFLEDVGLEGFEIVKKCKKKIGVSRLLPQVMIEYFLRDYLGIDCVLGRELKVIHGYFTGFVMDSLEDQEEEKVIKQSSSNSNSNSNNKNNSNGLSSSSVVADFEEMVARQQQQEEEEEEVVMKANIIGVCGSKSALDHPLFSSCEEIYITSETERHNWQTLPHSMYKRPLIFHDGRLATRPTPTVTLSILMWAPFGFLLAIFRAVVALSLPSKIANPILAFSGFHLLFSPQPADHVDAAVLSSSSSSKKVMKPRPIPQSGVLYVCNHKTLLDPLYLSTALNKPLTAVTYSLSRISEILAPIKTVRLTRDRKRDGSMMKTLLKQGDLVVCPEGTTCREPYLLRFSPLFSEMSDHIIPVAMNCYVTMFYGTTASGFKFLDPIFFCMNPKPSYTVRLLDVVPGLSRCPDVSESMRFDVANHVQGEIGRALRFECTRLTRKDKYLVLAGNNGVTN